MPRVLLFSALASTLLALCGCGRRSHEGCWKVDRDDVFYLQSSWLFDDGTALAVGASRIFRFDDGGWSKIQGLDKLLSDMNDITTVAGRSPDDVWVDTELHFNGTSWKLHKASVDLDDVDVASDGTLLGVGRGKHLARLDGSSWSWTTPFSEDQHGVWVADAKTAFTVGEEGSRYLYDGKAWTRMAGEKGILLTGVWGSSSKDVWAVGQRPVGLKKGPGVILHYDGSSWKQLPGSFETLSSVSGSGKEVFVAGRGGVLRKEGDRFTTYLDLPRLFEEAYDIHVRGGRLVFVYQWLDGAIRYGLCVCNF